MLLKTLFEDQIPFDLSNKAVFQIKLGPWELYTDEEAFGRPMDGPVNEALKFFTTETPPGITPINDVKVLDVKPIDDGDDTLATVEMRVEDFIRNGIEFDTDPYEILADVKKYAGPEAAKAALHFLKTATDLRVAGIGSDGAEQHPARPNL